MNIVKETPNVKPLGRYNYREASAALGVHPNTIRNWVRRGIFRANEKATRTIGGVIYNYVTGAGILRIYNIKS